MEPVFPPETHAILPSDLFKSVRSEYTPGFLILGKSGKPLFLCGYMRNDGSDGTRTHESSVHPTGAFVRAQPYRAFPGPANPNFY